MPMLTNPAVEALQPREKDYVAWCSDLTGFGCRVRPSGRKTFIAQYRVGGGSGPARKFTVGTYPAMTASDARKAAKKVLLAAQTGDDPAEKRKDDRVAITVAELCAEYLAEGCGHKKPSTMATDKGSIARHIIPLLGSKKVKDVTKIDVQRFATSVAKGDTAVDEKTKKHGRARVTGGQGAANRTVRLLGGIFTFAIDRGYTDKNPRVGVKEARPDRKCERFLSTDELSRLGDTLAEAETIGLPWQFNDEKKAKHRPVKAENQREVISPYAIAAIRLLILTGMRCGEVLSLKWSYVDFERGVLNLPDSKTKAKKVFVGTPALALLETVPRIKDNPYVIAGADPKLPRSDIKRPWARIIAHAGLGKTDEQEALRLHDLRHTFASAGAGAGMGLPIVGKLLGHASTATTARYAHIADDPTRRAADGISGGIAAAMGMNVIPIRKEAA